MPHRNGDCRSNSNRRVAHHDRGELEHHFGQPFASRENYLFRSSPYLRQRDCEQNREEHDLQNLVLAGRLEKALWHYVLEKTHPGRGSLRELLSLISRSMNR